MIHRRPVRDEVRVGNQDAGRVGMGAKHANRLSGLHKQRLVVAQRLQGFGDEVEVLPSAGGLADAAVHHEFVGVLSNLRIEVVHQHPVRGFGEP